MRELIGLCRCCQKEIYCLDGFFNGVHSKDNELFCFECFEAQIKEDPQNKD